MPDKAFENNALKQGYRAIAGLDEAGRGPLAGPVVACACILPQNIEFPNFSDSKQLSKKVRQILFKYIVSHPLIHFGIGQCSPYEIDQLNILRATERAMHRAVDNLNRVPDYLLIDGKHLSHPYIAFETIVKGDQKSQSIAAASIVAKEIRDEIMRKLDEQYPEYGFAKHKGYPTQEHYRAIEKYGVTEQHRLSFNLKVLSN